VSHRKLRLRTHHHRHRPDRPGDNKGGGAADNGTVLCQVEGPDGRITTIGSFQLTDGYGYWGSPDPATNGPLTGARLVTTTGAILATATFPT